MECGVEMGLKLFGERKRLSREICLSFHPVNLPE